MKSCKNKERRKYLRHPLQVPLVCQCREHLGQHQGELRDIGCGGMGFASSSTFEVGDVISVDYPTIDSQALLGEIMWSDSAGDGTRQHSYGLRFLDCEVFMRARLIEQICCMQIYRRAQREKHGRRLSANEAAGEWISKQAARFPGFGRTAERVEPVSQSLRKARS